MAEVRKEQEELDKQVLNDQWKQDLEDLKQLNQVDLKGLMMEDQNSDEAKSEGKAEIEES